MAKRKKLRRAGNPWRILVHEYLGGRPKYGVGHNVASDSTFGGGDGTDSEWSKHIELPGTEFDELVVGNWIHLEQMDTGTWWLNVGGITLWVRADRDGQPIRVDVYGPDDYAEPVDGCEYQCVWSRDEKERPLHASHECAERHDLVVDFGAGRPEIVVLCGSTRFYDEFQQANYDLTMAGRIVLSVGFYPHAKAVHGHGEGVGHDSIEKAALDELHKRKIDLADSVFVLNVGGYIGESTRSEVEYAEELGKPIFYLEERAPIPAASVQSKVSDGV